MPTEQMSIDERRTYLKIMLPRYAQADRAEQGRLLEEMQAITAMHRKSLLRLLHGATLDRQPRQHQRGHAYDQFVWLPHVAVVAPLTFTRRMVGPAA